MVSADIRRDGETGRGETAAVVAVVVLTTLGVLVPAVGPVAAQSDTVTVTVVVETESGDTVTNATVDASWDGGSTRATTAGNGRAFLDVPAGETVTYRIEHPEYVRNRPFRATRTSDDEVTIPVAPAASLTVVAVTEEDDPIEGATVSVVRRGRTAAEGTTDADGRYTSPDIEAQQYQIRISKPGYFTSRETDELSGHPTRQFTLRTGTVEYRFRVRDDHFDPPRPVENATIQVGTVGSVRTLADGRASIGIPVNTVQQVQVTKPGHESVTRRVEVEESRRNVTLTTRRSANVSLSATTRRVVVGERVTVTVRNAYDEPIEGATVLLNGSSVGETDASGQLAVRIDERGPHELRARRNALTSPPVTVTGVVPAGTETATPTATTTDDGSSGMAPGFGPLVALAALLAVGVAASRRR
jgi:PGF-CTERM protein